MFCMNVTGVRSGAALQTTALPVCLGAGQNGSVITHDAAAGEDLVSEPPLHSEAPADAAAGGGDIIDITR